MKPSRLALALVPCLVALALPAIAAASVTIDFDTYPGGGVVPGLALTRFRGHLTIWVGGSHDAQEGSTPTAVSS